MCSPESAISGSRRDGIAEIGDPELGAAARERGRDRYCYEVCRDSMVAALSGSGSSHRVVEPIAEGTCEPQDPSGAPAGAPDGQAGS